jgi:XRE family transcriptional regulator, aerobic/anaerobic benzoate catabolism transcriptional regulator
MRPEAILSLVGKRLAAARERAGLTLAEAAKRAGVSRRYLSMAEHGDANLSLLKLAALASALRLPLRELCDLDLGGAPELRVALLGLRGAGKSSVGRALARRLEVPFFELDRLVEDQAGMSLGPLFEIHGESRYRELQRAALEQWLEHHGSGVLATGGSIARDEPAFARLRSTCRTVWLKASPEEHWQRVVDQGDMRPMRNNPRAMAELKQILATREPSYALADLTAITSGQDVEGVAREIEAWVTAKAGSR